MKSVYTGGEKVAEFESYDELRVGENKPAFIYEGNELVYPNPVKDGLVLWYDFSGRTNTDGQRGIAEDLSGNGNHGTLQNFNYTAESGYDKNKLLFDGVDDGVLNDNSLWQDTGTVTLEAVFDKEQNGKNGAIIGATSANFEMLIYGDKTIVGYYSDGTASRYRQYQMSLNTNKINHAVIVFRKSEDRMEIYINGKKERDWTNAVVEDMSGFNSYAKISLGNRNNTNNLNGNIYSTRIYNKALTPEEIAHNYAIEKERFGIE